MQQHIRRITLTSIAVYAALAILAPAADSPVKHAHSSPSVPEGGVDARLYLPLAFTQLGPELRLVGHVGGGFGEIVVEGSLGAAIIGPRLVLVDVSDLAHPRVLGQSGPLLGTPTGVVLKAGFAWTVAGLATQSALHGFDVRRPRHPRHAVTVPLPAQESARMSGRLLAGDGRRVIVAGEQLVVVDVSRPLEAHVQGVVDIRWVPANQRMLLAGDRVYLLDGSALLTVDIRDPWDPVIVSSHQPPVPHINARGADIVVDDRTLYIALDREPFYEEPGGVWIVDVSHRELPRTLSFTEIYGYSRVFVVRDRLLALGRMGDHVPFHVYDIKDRENPQRLNAPGALLPTDHVSVADVDAEMTVVDLAPHGAPPLLALRMQPLQIADVSVDGDSAAAVGGGRLTLVEVRQSSPVGGMRSTPVDAGQSDSAHVVGFVDVPRAGTTPYADSVALDGDTAYFVDGTSGVFWSVDVSDPARPRLLGSIAASRTCTPQAQRIAIIGDHALVAGGGVTAVDVSDPHTPRIAGRLPMTDLNHRGCSVVVAGSLAFATAAGGFAVIDVSDLPAMTLVGAVTDRRPHDAIAVHDRTVFASSTWPITGPGIEVFNLRDPRSPLLSEVYTDALEVAAMASGRGFLYAGSSDPSAPDLLRVFASHSTRPLTELARFPDPGSEFFDIEDVEQDGHRVYVVSTLHSSRAYSEGLFVLEHQR